MVAVGIPLCLAVAYLVHGSLEMFPTPEQQDNVRVVAGTIAGGLGVVEIALWWVQRRLSTADRPRTERR